MISNITTSDTSNTKVNAGELLSTPPPEVEDAETLRKQYENMTYDEMSKRLAESYQQFEEILGKDHLGLTKEEQEEEEEEVEMNDIIEGNLSEQEKREKCTKIFQKSVTSGDLEKVQNYLQDNRKFIDINGKDEQDGTTPLIYTACFGKYDMAQALVLAGANVNNQDSHGWTALIWATANNHENLVKLLLDHGASAQTKSTKGRTVLDFVKSNDTHTNKVADIIHSNHRDSISSTSSIMGLTTVESVSSSSSSSGGGGSGNGSHYYRMDENYENFMSHDSKCRPKLMEQYLYNNSSNNNEDYDDTDSMKEAEFIWDKCMPDQMFVFAADDLPYILDTVITNLELPILPINHAQEIYLPTNVIFLSARFAHYYSSAELAEEVMEGSIQRINTIIKNNTTNVHILSYWMTNITRLLYYLKKDAELMVATAEYQLRLSELVSETYNSLVNDICKRIAQILEPAMLEHDPISGMEDVNFADDWQRFFRRNTNRRSLNNAEMMQRTSSQMSTASSTFDVPARFLSPKTITQLFDSTLYIFRSYEVHSTIVIQALAQFFHSLSCELFNHILAEKKYLCRSKAIQVRMNLSILEEWIRSNNLPNDLITYLNPSVQLVQLLQCVSQLDTVQSFQTTIKMFDSINSLQIKRCVMNYRYETNEVRLPEDIVKLVDQDVDEIMRLKNARQSRTFERGTGQSLRRSLSGRGGDSSSISQIMGSLLTSVGMTPSPSCSMEEKRLSDPSQMISQSLDDDQEDKEIQITKDSRFMLPFFVPTIAQLSHAIMIIPAIPEDWMDKLDTKGE